MIVDPSAIFVLVEVSGKAMIVRVPKGQGAAKVLDTGGVNTPSILLDDTSLYVWTAGDRKDKIDFQVYRIPKTGGPRTTVLRGPTHRASGLTLVEGWFCFSSDPAIMRASVRGGSRFWLASANASELLVDRSNIYFTTKTNATINHLFLLPLAGGTIEHAGDVYYLYNRFARDGQELYFGDCSKHEEGYVGKLAL